MRDQDDPSFLEFRDIPTSTAAPRFNLSQPNPRKGPIAGAVAVAGGHMPLCRPLGNGLWEVRTSLPTKRTARVLLGLYRENLVALHGFIKKTRTTPTDDLALARKRQKELER